MAEEIDTQTPQREAVDQKRLVRLRSGINLAIAKAKFRLLPKHEQDRRASEALKTIRQLVPTIAAAVSFLLGVAVGLCF